MSLQNNPLSNFGIGLGSEIGKAGIGLGQAFLKGSNIIGNVMGAKQNQYDPIIKSMESIKKGVYEKPFEKQLDSFSGKAGEFFGMAAPFVATTGAVTSSQNIMRALLENPIATTRGIPAAGKLISGGLKLGSKVLPETAISGATEYARTGGDYGSAKMAGLFAGGTVGALALGGKAAQKTFWPVLQDSVTKALGLQGRTTAGKVLGKIDDKVAGMAVLKKYAPEVGFDTKNANYESTIKAYNSIKESIFNKYDQIAQKAGQKTTLNLESVADGLSQIVTGKRTSAYKDAARSYLQDLVDNFAIINPATKEITWKPTDPKVMQDFLADLYKDAATTIAGRSDKAYGEIAASTARNIKGLLDDAISKAEGPEYGALRSEYSALKSIEEDLVRKFQQEARKIGGGLGDYVDIFSSGDVIAGILTANPQLVAAGVTRNAMTRVFQALKQPDRYLRRSFKLIDGRKSSELSERLFGVPNQLSPNELNAVNTIKKGFGAAKEYGEEYVKNPKIGMSIEDVSKKISLDKNGKGVFEIYYGDNPKTGQSLWKKVRTTPQKASAMVRKLNKAGYATMKQIDDPAVQSTSKKTSPSVGQTDNLISEAKKYKSAEEFVKAQGTPVYRGEGGSNVAQGKALLAEGKHFASDSKYPQGFGKVSENIIKPNAKVLDLGDSTFAEISKKLGIPDRRYISPKELSAIAKEKGYDVLKYNGEYKSTGKQFTHFVDLTGDSTITKSQLTDIWNKAQTATPKIDSTKWLKDWVYREPEEAFKHKLTPELEQEFSKYKPKKPVKLYRGVTSDETGKAEFSSWSYSKDVAKEHTYGEGKVISKMVDPEDIILDTTEMPYDLRQKIGIIEEEEEVLVRNSTK